MPVTIDTANSFLTAYEAFERADGPAWAPWISPVRKAAMARFAQLGFPTIHDEEWRFTNVAPIARTAFLPAASPERPVTQRDLASAVLDGPTGARLVFVNGIFAPALSSGDRIEGLTVESLARSFARPADVTEKHLARCADYTRAAFTALNTALFEDGVLIHVAPRCTVEQPIQLVFVTVPSAEPIAAYPRILIVAEEGSQVAIVETYVGLGDGIYLTNTVTELIAGADAAVDHYKLQRESEGAYHVGMLQIHQQRSSDVSSHSLSFGGRLVRNHMHVVLAGDGGTCALHGLFMPGGEQHMDHHLRVEHAAPHTSSREYFKGILDGESRGVFSGRIVVHKAGQKTDAKQTNKNLLLSEHAQIDTKPHLEIFADDVKCTHGATIGQIDADAVFYLRSRGIPEDAARGFLTYAFANESLDQIRIPALRRQVTDYVLARLPHGELYRELR